MRPIKNTTLLPVAKTTGKAYVTKTILRKVELERDAAAKASKEAEKKARADRKALRKRHRTELGQREAQLEAHWGKLHNQKVAALRAQLEASQLTHRAAQSAIDHLTAERDAARAYARELELKVNAQGPFKGALAKLGFGR